MAYLLGGLLATVVTAAVPMFSNGLIDVPRPQEVDLNAARREAAQVRPVVPYQAPAPYTGGRVRVLLIGINYKGTKSELSGCVNDVYQMMGTLQRIQFPISECCILVDDPKFPNFTDYPTRRNMIKYMTWLTSDVRPGDVLFIHYSGHGGQTKAVKDTEEAYDQTLCPMDYREAGTILDDDLFNILVASLPAGVRMTCVFDCCHSATMLDLPFSFVVAQGMKDRQGYTMQQIRRNNFSSGDVVMFSGCDDAGTSADVRTAGGGAGGAATQAFTWALLNTQGLSYMDILLKTRDQLRAKKYKQVTQLTASKPIDLYKPFSLFGTITVNQQQMTQSVPAQFRVPPPPQQQQQQFQQYQYPPQQRQAPQQQFQVPPPQQQYRPPPQQPSLGYPVYAAAPPQATYAPGYAPAYNAGPQPPGRAPQYPPPTQYTYNPNPM